MAALENQAEKYRNIIKQFLSKHATNKPFHGDIEMKTIFDNEQDHLGKSTKELGCNAPAW